MATEIRIIVLDVGHLDKVVRRYEKGWVVRFVCGPSLLGSKVVLRTSLTGETPLKWNEGLDQTSNFIDVICDQAGSFKYSFELNEEEKTKGSGYFLVMPTLAINGEVLPNGAVVCQTYLTKLLGALPEWEKRLSFAAESGYNMIHLTPIHELGISNSSYSLSDHHGLIQTMHTDEKRFTLTDVDVTVKNLEKQYGLLTVQDVVWNHAAKNSNWLQEHPECSYNCWNSPHLRPAYVIDRIYHYFSREVAQGIWESRGIPAIVDNDNHLQAIDYVLRNEVLPKGRIHEFFEIDVHNHVETFKNKSKSELISSCSTGSVRRVADPQWKRFGSTIDWTIALKVFNTEQPGCSSEEERIEICSSNFKNHLLHLNEEARKYAAEAVNEGLNAVMGHITYERCADHGPHKGRVCEKEPLTTDYFLSLYAEKSWEDDENLAYSEKTASHLMAFNGWVMSSNVLQNFALSDSQVYLRRQLVCWGDSVKLNYGERPEDCPYLWSYMKEYTESCARIFHGVRIDNAHGTPIHVAEYLLRAARMVRSDLYVFAELFTGSEDLDNMFVNRLGISALIREAESAHDSHEQGRLVFRYSGDCVGALIQKSARLAPSVVANGLFFDQTHDNPSPIQVRSVHDVLPTAAMVSMATCATGSTRGYDELVPFPINVVTETRPYHIYEKSSLETVGIVKARKLLNDLHVHLSKNNYSQVFVDQMNPDVVAITRHNPINHSTIIVVSHTLFDKNAFKHGVNVKHIPIGGVLEEVMFEMRVVESNSTMEYDPSGSITGLTNYKTDIRENLTIHDSHMATKHGDHIELSNFPSGSVIGFKVRLADDQLAAINEIRDILSRNRITELLNELEALTLLDFNHLLFCCSQEDQVNVGVNPYDVPNFGTFVYGGLHGIVTVLKKIRESNDLGHPLCSNIRDGLWLVGFIVNRLRKYNGLEKIADICDKWLGLLDKVPYYLRPSYFESVLSLIYDNARSVLLKKLKCESSSLIKMLALSTVSLVGIVKDAHLAPLHSSITGPSCSLAAGLTHFATGIWRNWGRDTFIALPGCLLLTNRFEDARRIILSFAGCLRHGLIPNLLAEGIGARYNCRDAVWFWLYSIARYTEIVPNGVSILSDTVLRIYPEDSTIYGESTREELLIDTMYEALQRHFSGISYRERNAGHTIDEQMLDEGFNVKVWVDKSTGFVHGGNQYNCGTWMDKMGSSVKAGNKGLPATPRDGAAVELQGLAASVLSHFHKWATDGTIQFKTVTHDDLSWTWDEWLQKIHQSFQQNFYISQSCTDKYVNRRDIIKDTVGSSLGYTDFQLRCNYPIALAVHPEILDPLLSWKALNTAAEHLTGPLGMKTLDPSDWEYNGYYNNSDDSDSKQTARGWNYHQGPEWLWVAGTYLKARLRVAKILGGEYLVDAEAEVQRKLGAYYRYLQNSSWGSLPELTQKDGAECYDSCAAQAWSISCLLEVCLLLGS
ncbi:unnamed protein product [Auanema sp. JU1783]|nr:unnamed protein product [Auanema sp. JU1783]